MEPLRGEGVRGLTVAVVRVAVEIIPKDGDFGSWLMPTNEKDNDIILIPKKLQSDDRTIVSRQMRVAFS